MHEVLFLNDGKWYLSLKEERVISLRLVVYNFFYPYFERNMCDYQKILPIKPFHNVWLFRFFQIPGLRPYVPYCAQQMSRKNFIDNKIRGDSTFADFLQVGTK